MIPLTSFLKMLALSVCLVPVFITCKGQNNTAMNKTSQPLLCDTATGVCAMPGHEGQAHSAALAGTGTRPVRIIYFTDPICSSCWGIEPQLRKLKLEYGDDIQIEYHMGGLLRDWHYNSEGISKPADVAHHWDEVSRHYNMPIDGDVWLQDPLASSFPPSIAFKAAQLQDEARAIAFLRILREMVFLERKNITRWEHLEKAAGMAGLDTLLLREDYEGRARAAFEADLQLAAGMGVRGFPTVFVADTSGRTEVVYGFRPYEHFERAIRQIYPAAEKRTYGTAWEQLFSYYPTLTVRELAELGNMTLPEAGSLLNKLLSEGKVRVVETKNGNLYKKK